ncbi:YggS family pyridoxal phosphate-dependent enzyme [Magnetovirga frankeli]|uniref:YggS family pyridoxal phosphate-dependent enzyme n=1 Tax=Magnetovirga frankeli TaxID=947516 RepID=UPI001292F8FC|nr:YggS family pyridoxal phosphate-dependent enzyme [gamma proteobacterium SS-5]
MTEIAKNLNQLREQIQQLAQRHGYRADDILLLAVSKTKPASAIRAAFAAGQRHFGENYLQEALEKQGELADLPLEWHFIGRIQGNKTRPIAEHFSWAHSLDSLKHAQRLAEQRPAPLPPLNVCLQVNLSGEASKGGVAPEQLPSLAEQVAQLPRLRLRGLMTLPAPASDLAQQRRPFHQLAELKQRLCAQGLALDTLSMGMSADLEAAIAEGSTLVRIGTALFGSRVAGQGAG